MKQSNLPIKTLRHTSQDAKAISHKLLIRAGFIDQLTSGVYSYLPLGFRVLKKVENIIREEIESVGANELLLPSLQPKDIWKKTGRWESIDPPLFKLKDRHNKEMCLGSTHEEVITSLAAKHITSYKDLPFAWFQIQNKFRNEMRTTGGLLRVCEFMMMDLYSFHADQSGQEEFYKQVADSYKRIYKRCGLNAYQVNADTGTIGGNTSHEFVIVTEAGEDTIYTCTDCDWAQNKELGEPKECSCCGGKVISARGIEVGHIFNLSTKYSETLGATYKNKQGDNLPVEMGCYGIGLGRLIATIVEVHHDDKGIIWPREVAPFDVHLIKLDDVDCEEIYKTLSSKHEVLYDDREITAGQKFAEADLFGIPIRIVVSSRTLQKECVEVKERANDNAMLIPIKELAQKFF